MIKIKLILKKSYLVEILKRQLKRKELMAI